MSIAVILIALVLGFLALKFITGVIKFGVLVPTKVERTALQNAASVAGLLLTTDALISEVKAKKKAAAGAGMEDMDY